MSLSTFISNNLDAIVAEWESFAKTVSPMGATMSKLELQDHCREILLAAAANMGERQTEGERETKSQGNAPPEAGASGAAAEHGTGRHLSGFDIEQLVAEFRALRASVLSLWKRRKTTGAAADVGDAASEVEEITRFNEAIDQALAESLVSYSVSVNTSRDMFLAILGHDLRTPLQAIGMTGRLLLKPDLSDKARHDAAMRIQRSSTAMDLLINDLLEFTRSQLGAGIPLARTTCDLGPVCAAAIETIRAGNPQQAFEEHISGDLVIWADAPRLQQALVNLLSNAVQHGDGGRPVSLLAQAADDAVELSVTNFGRPIPAPALQTIFEPLVRGPSAGEDIHEQSKTSLGLGLFIVREIVAGHAGTVTVQSSAEAGTVFTIRVPRAHDPSPPT